MYREINWENKALNLCISDLPAVYQKYLSRSLCIQQGPLEQGFTNQRITGSNYNFQIRFIIIYYWLMSWYPLTKRNKASRESYLMQRKSTANIHLFPAHSKLFISSFYDHHQSHQFPTLFDFQYKHNPSKRHMPWKLFLVHMVGPGGRARQWVNLTSPEEFLYYKLDERKCPFPLKQRGNQFFHCVSSGLIPDKKNIILYMKCNKLRSSQPVKYIHSVHFPHFISFSPSAFNFTLLSSSHFLF